MQDPTPPLKFSEFKERFGIEEKAPYSDEAIQFKNLKATYPDRPLFFIDI